VIVAEVMVRRDDIGCAGSGGRVASEEGGVGRKFDWGWN
jgi:hypothetical protein